ncbi:MAG: P-loop NTPase family protein [Cyanobacteria bacterium]|nr:P-loop NTPase family protein [Cyanobacteriota bacterium]MDA0864938.1 P-loop NTPase family protein [Cyanobacteriota bacterium]
MVSQVRVSPPATLSHSARLLAHPLLHTVEGTVQVFTSPHRTFFTKVMVQAMRRAGQGDAVLVVQFLKGGIRQGTARPMQFGQTLEWIRADLSRCLHTAEVTDAERETIAQLWEETQALAQSGQYALVVLDELSLAIQFGLISEASALSFLTTRPSQVDVILTGPEMPEALLAIADQVTEFRRQFLP